MEAVKSLQNQKIKSLIKLQKKSRARRKENKFVIEGEKEILAALDSGFQPHQMFILEGLVKKSLFEKLSMLNIELISVSGTIYQKIAYRGNTEGVLGIFQTKEQPLNNLNFSKNPLILVAEAPEKPGNIGALLRTADAANLDAVLIANPKTDLFNPNIIRSSVGSIFSVPVATGSSAEIIDFLKNKAIGIYATTLQNSNSYLEADFKKPSALVVGTENSGLSQEWREAASQNITIPMRGENDSLNVSVSAGVFIFEALRQRNLN
jgi:TrmH family RNA methyltransferase